MIWIILVYCGLLLLGFLLGWCICARLCVGKAVKKQGMGLPPQPWPHD